MAVVPASSFGSGGSGGGGADTQLYNLVRATDGTFDQSGIVATYNSLRLVLVCQSDRGAAATIDQIWMRFNNDATANYGWQQINGAATTTTSTQGFSTNQIQVGDTTAVALTTQFGMYEILIPGYASASYWKCCHMSGTYPFAITSGGPNNDRNIGVYKQASPSAISRIQIFPAIGTNWKAGSTLQIYGVN